MLPRTYEHFRRKYFDEIDDVMTPCAGWRTKGLLLGSYFSQMQSTLSLPMYVTAMQRQPEAFILPSSIDMSFTLKVLDR